VILTDREIKLAIEKRQIVIDPRPQAQAFSSTTVDLVLDPNITAFIERNVDEAQLIIDPGHPDFQSEQTLAQIYEKRVIDFHNGYLLKPNSCVLAWTQEYVKLISSSRIAARVEGKGWLTRLGLGVHVTAPTIYPGFVGHICLELFNRGNSPIRLRVGMRICQLVFEQTLGAPDKGYPLDFLPVSMTDTF
jgi:dCTP deaminase